VGGWKIHNIMLAISLLISQVEEHYYGKEYQGDLIIIDKLEEYYGGLIIIDNLEMNIMLV